MRKGEVMPETLVGKPARAERQVAESEPGRRVEKYQPSNNWVREHALLVNYRADEGHKSGIGLHG